jgi:hypothetical protein
MEIKIKKQARKAFINFLPKNTLTTSNRKNKKDDHLSNPDTSPRSKSLSNLPSIGTNIIPGLIISPSNHIMTDTPAILSK